MKVLVTGGAGFIGSHVVDMLISEGHDVVVVDNLVTGHEANINPQARFYRLDIREPSLADVFERERPDAVNHHAAQMDVRKSVADPLYDADVNIKGTINLLECAHRYNVKKVVYVSTGGAVYGEPEYLPCDENHPINPLCQYGVSKHAVEHYLHVYCHLYGLDYVVLRYPNVYGPRQDPAGEAGVVAIFIGHMLADRPVTINGSGDQERDFVYVSDCARANLLALSAGSARIYNIGCGIGTSVNSVFAELKRITGYAHSPHYGMPKAGETFKIFLNFERAYSEMGWSPSVNLAEGLGLTVDYFRGHDFIGMR